MTRVGHAWLTLVATACLLAACSSTPRDMYFGTDAGAGFEVPPFSVDGAAGSTEGTAGQGGSTGTAGEEGAAGQGGSTGAAGAAGAGGATPTPTQTPTVEPAEALDNAIDMVQKRRYANGRSNRLTAGGARCR